MYFLFKCNNKSYYDKKLALNVVVEPKKVFELKNEFNLSIEEYDTKKLLIALTKNKFNKFRAFESLFH